MGGALKTEPYVSMNKLAEYVAARSASRRRSIIKNQIVRKPYMTVRYTAGKRVIARFMANPSAGVPQLLTAASSLRDKAATFPEGDDRRKYAVESAQAVEAFALVAEKIRNRKLLAVVGRNGAEMEMSGVRIGVNPDVCFLERGTERRIGALKLHCSKTFPLDAEGLQNAAAILYAYLEGQGDEPVKGACVAVNVLTAEYEWAPRAMKNRLRNIEAACEEIAGWWPNLVASMEAPDSYGDETE